MVSRESLAIYGSGLAQGVALVAFPAAGAIFTDAQAFGLSAAQYGALFLPQSLLAVATAMAGVRLAGKVALKRLLLIGLAANLLAMAALAGSAALQGYGVAYAVLLAATALLGVGFGSTVPTLNSLAAALAPQQVDKAILILNALLGLGTALAPLLVALFGAIGLWWGLPLCVAGALAALLLMVWPLPLRAAASAATAPPTQSVAAAPLWRFTACAFLYGVVETINGNWATIFMTEHVRATAATAALALTAFWAAVTCGRLLFAAAAGRMAPATVFHTLPLLLALSFILTASLTPGAAAAGVAAFALAGLGCSALLPLTISFATRALPAMGAAVASTMIAAYLCGYGVAAFGVGSLLTQLDWPLTLVFGGAAPLALALWLLTRRPGR